jgi:Fructose-bisphosphate aldolase class-II/Beta-lactamase
VTWAPGVAIPNLYGGPPVMAASMSHYGLGWLSGEYRGLRVVSHAGGTAGFTALVAFLPDADLGIAVLSNASALPDALAFTFAVHFRLLELLFDQPAGMDAQLSALVEATAATRPRLAYADPAAVASYLGRYTHPTFGEMTIDLRDNRLVLHAGKLASELRRRGVDGPSASVYLLHDPPLSFYSEAYGATVSFTGGIPAASQCVLRVVLRRPNPRLTIHASQAEADRSVQTADCGAEIENPHLAEPGACEAMGETGIDALAAAIGNAHGVYVAEPKLDFDLLAEIRRRTEVPLVLHGGSGVPVDQVQKAIGMGVAKMNVGTAIHVAFKEGMEESLAERAPAPTTS